MRVILDTNTIISGLLWEGNQSRIIEKAENKKFYVFISSDILQELTEVLERKKFSKLLENRNYTVETAISKIKIISMIVEPDITLDVVKSDPNDNIILECAVTANADMIISGDKHLLDIKKYSEIEILTAKQFLDMIEE